MNEIFSSDRFFKLLKKELTERVPMIVKMAGTFSLLLVGYWVSILIFDSGASSATSRATYSFFATFITMVIAPFNLYKSYNHPKKGIDYILLPASVTEKYLSMLINTVIILPLITFCAILFTDTIISTLSPSLFSGYAINSVLNTQGILESIADALIFQQGCIFGNFLFKKNKVSKTILSGAVIYLALALIVVFFLTVVVRDQFINIDTTNTHIVIGQNSLSQLGKLGSADGLGGAIKALYYFALTTLYVFMPIGFLYGTFYKMKTQQY